MEQFIGPVNVTYPAAVQAVLTDGIYQASARPEVEPTLELHPALFEVDAASSRHRLVTSYGRPVNVAFALAEVLWILGGRNDVATLQAFNDRIGDYSDDGKTFNAAYGERLRLAHGHDQLRDIIRLLQEEPDSRQGILNINLPSADRAYQPNWDADAMAVPAAKQVKRITRDRACNVMAHLMVRNGRLDWFQFIRSNDIVWGTPYNFMQWMHVHEFMAQSIGVPVGTYYHLADSLHMYAKHQDQARAEISPFDLYTAIEAEHRPMGFVGVQRAAIETMLAHISMLIAAENLDALPTPPESIVGPYWTDVWPILVAYRAYKMNQDELAAQCLILCGDAVLRMAQLRHFVAWRWNADQFAPLVNSICKYYPEDVTSWIKAGAGAAAVTGV